MGIKDESAHEEADSQAAQRSQRWDSMLSFCKMTYRVCEIINDFNFSDDPSEAKKSGAQEKISERFLDLFYKTDSKRNLLLKKIHGKWCQDTKNNNKKSQTNINSSNGQRV